MSRQEVENPHVFELAHRLGEFGKYIIDGIWLQNTSGKRLWRIVITSPTTGHTGDKRTNLACRLFEDKLSFAEIDTHFPNFPDFDVVLREVEPDVTPEIKDAVLEATHQWERHWSYSEEQVE